MSVNDVNNINNNNNYTNNRLIVIKTTHFQRYSTPHIYMEEHVQ